MRNICLMISRFSLAAWVGSACLFVVTTLQEVQSPKLDSVTKAYLAIMRFPVYYAFAFSLIGTGLVLAVFGLRETSRLRRRISLSLILTALLLAAIDFVWIYQPLAEMTAAVREARPANFIDYHRASMWINTVQLVVSVLAAFAICWPQRMASDNEQTR